MAKNENRKMRKEAEVTNEPWAPTQPYLNDIMGQAQNLYQSGGVQQNPWMQPTAEGAYLGDNNPYLATMYQGGADDIQRRVNSLHSGMGRYGSETHQDALADNLGQFYASIYAPAYESERNRQYGAQQEMYTDADALSWYQNMIGANAGLGGTQVQYGRKTPIKDLLGGIAGIAGAII
jgi:hypothetical protein